MLFFEEIGNIRLSSSTVSFKGRLEVYYWDPGFSFSWGTVCSDGFEPHDADVMCRKLGFMYANRVGTVGELG